MSLEQIADHAKRHRSETLPFDTSDPIDLSMPFLCPTLTALYYTPSWNQLSAADQIRYTQLSALSFNEIFAWIESSFTTTVVALSRGSRLPESIRQLLPGFIEDEARHQRMWHVLNQHTDPKRYQQKRMAITRIAPLARLLIRLLASRPFQFPVAVWLMLILEEHANEISRRCAERRPDLIEPHFAAAYLAHVRDEARHVQIDWHLIECLWPKLSSFWGAVNAWLFRQVVCRMLFRTENAAISVVRALAAERADVRAILPRIEAELREVGASTAFREMMFSAKSSPIAFQLVQRYPALAKALQ